MKTIKLHRPPKVPALEWSRAPSRSRDPQLGLRKRWSTRDRCFAIDCFPEATGRFIALSRLPDPPAGDFKPPRRTSHVIGDFGTLAAAKRACQAEAKARGLGVGG